MSCRTRAILPAFLLLYEVYASEADAAVHKQTAHDPAWRDAVAEMMAEPRRGVSWVLLRSPRVEQ